MPTPRRDVPEITYDAQSAERGYRDTAALRAEVKDAMLPALDLQQAAIFGLRMAALLATPALASRFAKIHADLLSPAVVNRIGPASWALWFANTQRATAEAGETRQRVSVATLARADAIRKRMLRVGEYIFADDPELGPEVASIRAGAGHADVASDLTRLAAIYSAHPARVAAAGEHYRADDAEQARLAAGAILTELAQRESTTAAEARKEAARAFAVLDDAYGRVRRFALAIFDDGEARFPTIFTLRGAGRSGGGGGEVDGPPSP